MYAARLYKSRNRIASNKVIPRRVGDHEYRSIKTSQRSNARWWTIANLDVRQRIDNQGSNEMLDLFFSKRIYTALRLLAVPIKPYDTRSAHQPMLIGEGSHSCSELTYRELGWQQDHKPCRRFLGNSECVHGERGERIWKYRPKSIYPFCGDPSLFIWGPYVVANGSRHGVWADPEFYPTAFGGLGFSEPHQLRVCPFECDTYFGQPGQTTPLRATDRPSGSSRAGSSAPHANCVVHFREHRLPRFSKIAPEYVGV